MPSITNVGATLQYMFDNVGQTLNPVDMPSIPLSGGSSGSGKDTTYTYTQVIPSIIWTIVHMLNRYPSVTLVDTMGRVVQPDITYNSSNEISVSFAFPMSGSAYLN